MEGGLLARDHRLAVLVEDARAQEIRAARKARKIPCRDLPKDGGLPFRKKTTEWSGRSVPCRSATAVTTASAPKKTWSGDGWTIESES